MMKTYRLRSLLLGTFIYVVFFGFFQIASAANLTDAQCASGGSNAVCLSRPCADTERTIDTCAKGPGGEDRFCCAPKPLKWTARQCESLGGKNATSDCNDVSNTFDAGAWLNTKCQEVGRCCLPSGNFSASNPLPVPNICTPIDVGSGGPTALSYTLLEKIPGSDTIQGDLPSYLKNLYKFAFWVIGIAALLMISVGGFMYATSAGNTSRMGTAKTIIFDSLIGIAIALLAWLFLYVINPDLVEIKLPTITSVTTKPPTAAAYSFHECTNVMGGIVTSDPDCSGDSALTGRPFRLGDWVEDGVKNGSCCGSAPTTGPVSYKTGDPWPSDENERKQLPPGVSVNKNNCAKVGDAGCTSLYGSAAIGSIINLKNSCGNCSIVISGGTECWLHGKNSGGCAGNTSHKPGGYGIDFGHGDIDDYIKLNGTKICDKNGRPVYRIGGAVFWDEDSAHWHANFNNSTCNGI